MSVLEFFFLLILYTLMEVAPRVANIFCISQFTFKFLIFFLIFLLLILGLQIMIVLFSSKVVKWSVDYVGRFLILVRHIYWSVKDCPMAYDLSLEVTGDRWCSRRWVSRDILASKTSLRIWSTDKRVARSNIVLKHGDRSHLPSKAFCSRWGLRSDCSYFFL